MISVMKSFRVRMSHQIQVFSAAVLVFFIQLFLSICILRHFSISTVWFTIIQISVLRTFAPEFGLSFNQWYVSGNVGLIAASLECHDAVKISSNFFRVSFLHAVVKSSHVNIIRILTTQISCYIHPPETRFKPILNSVYVFNISNDKCLCNKFKKSHGGHLYSRTIIWPPWTVIKDTAWDARNIPQIKSLRNQHY